MFLYKVVLITWRWQIQRRSGCQTHFFVMRRWAIFTQYLSITHMWGSFQTEMFCIVSGKKFWNHLPWLYFNSYQISHKTHCKIRIIWPNISFIPLKLRISLTLACPMNLKLYPMDRQTCSLRIASCKYIWSIFATRQNRYKYYP